MGVSTIGKSWGGGCGDGDCGWVEPGRTTTTDDVPLRSGLDERDPGGLGATRLGYRASATVRDPRFVGSGVVVMPHAAEEGLAGR